MVYGLTTASMFFELGLWLVMMRMMLMVMGWGNLFYLTVQMCETSWGVSCRLQPTSTQEESLWYTFPTHNQFSAHPIKQKALPPSLFWTLLQLVIERTLPVFSTRSRKLTVCTVAVTAALCSSTVNSALSVHYPTTNTVYSALSDY